MGHLVSGAWLEEFVQLQLFWTRKVNECPKGIGLVSNFINFLGEKKDVIDFLIDFYIFYKSDIKTFLRIQFSYKLGCTLRLQLHSISFYWMWQIHHWVPFSSHILHACKLSKRAIIMPSINCLNSKFYSVKLRIKNKFMHHTVNNIWLSQNLTCVLRI